MERMLSSIGRGWKRKEFERDGRVSIVCDNCGRRGYFVKNCWGKIVEERVFGKLNWVIFLFILFVGLEI